MAAMASVTARGAAAAAANPAALEPSPWSERLTWLEQHLEPSLGAWIGAEILPGVTWLQILLGVVILVLVVIVWSILRGLCRRWSRKQAETPTPEPGDRATAATPRFEWWRLTLEAAIPPLTLLAWAAGLYAAGSILFVRYMGTDGRSLIGRSLAWMMQIGEIIATFWFVFRMLSVLGERLLKWSGRTKSPWDNIIAAVVIRALRLVVPLIAVILILPTLSFPPSAEGYFLQGSSLVLIGAVGFISYELAVALERAILTQYKVDSGDNLAARKITTQVQVLKKLAVVVIVVLTVASMLMVFPSVRQLGASMLTSAGVLGIILGFAAQRSIATVVAGFQIALTQPIRLDDVVIVENEWGRIEEIALTYVVVRIWDLRRLIVPINYFIERPFQNWTRVSADLLGVVTLYADYTVPVAELRPFIEGIVKASKNWDGKFWNLQVTDATERTMQLRILATSQDASKSWDLRCEIREKILGHLQKHHPESLPRLRAEIPSLPGPPGMPLSSPVAPMSAA